MSIEIKILIAEDHDIVREAIKLVLEAQPDLKVIGEATNGDEAVALARTLLPDILLMDIAMPKTNGITATRIIKRENPKIKIVALSRHDEDGYLQQMLEAGASGFALKQSPPVELVNAVRSVAAGDTYLDPAMTTRVVRAYTPRKSDELSPRESEVLRLAALGYANKEIAAHLQVSVKLVESEKSRAMKRTNLADRVALMRYAVKQNWLQDT